MLNKSENLNKGRISPNSFYSGQSEQFYCEYGSTGLKRQDSPYD
jgi:hypothetical protein